MRYSVFFCSLFLLACGKTTPDFVNHIESHETDGETVWTLAKPGATKRILLIHGLTVDHTTFYDGAPALLVDHLWKSGYEIMFIDLKFTTDPAPYTRLRNILTPDYAPQFQDRIDKVVKFGNEFFKSERKITIGGISWGGVHTLMAASQTPSCDKYFAFIPVIDVQSLVDFKNMDLPNFSPFNFENALAQKKGYMSYSGLDAAVDPAIQSQFASQMADKNLTPKFYPTYKHELTNRMMIDLIEWIEK